MKRLLRSILVTQLLLVPAVSVLADDVPPPEIDNFFEGWDWFMKLREGHPVMKKLDPDLAAEWWQRKGNELWRGRGPTPHRTSVEEDSNGLVALEILIDDPKAWATMAHLLGSRGTAHMRLVDPEAPPPSVPPKRPATEPDASPPTPLRRSMDDLPVTVRDRKPKVDPPMSTVDPNELAKMRDRQKEVAKRLEYAPERVAENLWSVLVTVPFDAVEKFAAHPHVVAIAATVLSGEMQFDEGSGSRRTEGLDRHRTAEARTRFPAATGRGASVAIVSDGVENLEELQRS